ncbi:MAG TPA: MFS transporter [Ktedonobacterales bacterium]|jgi:MFS family permease
MSLDTQDSLSPALAAPSAPRSLWREGGFMKLWIGQTISMAGSAVTDLALPLTAILLLHASPLQLGLLLAVNSAAAAVFGLFAGAWSDRVRRRPLMVLADVGRALLMGAVPVAAVLGALRIEELYVVAAGVGALDSLFAAAYQGFLPSLVRRDQLVSANSRFEGSRVLAQVLGPGLSGALVQLLTAPFALLVDALSFLFSGGCIWFIRDPQSAPAKVSERVGLWRQIGEGLRFMLAHPLVRSLLLTVVIFNLFNPLLNAQSVLFATRELGLSPLLLGLGIVAAGACGVLASMATSAITSRLGMGWTMTVATGMICGGWLLVPFVHGVVPVAFALFALGASVGTMGDVLFNINAATLRQIVVPDRLRGRVSASMMVVRLGVQPLGALAGGVLGEQIGLRPTLLIAALGFGLGFLSMFFLPLRRVRQPDAAQAE